MGSSVKCVPYSVTACSYAIAPSFCADGFASNGLICPAQVDFGCFDFIGH